ncbi:hypothetical protein OCB16_03370 [Bacillus cereus]|uniref:hypothetical protein n=1 Tax=Bacillus cereus TaxID=1396 RepID=UPI0007ABBBF3|nr:hypothetical protein [Bacillus cereus]KZD30934.1 hypothetical protein B4081_3742 [Bacillus cereus]MCU5658286.1 hypothetical protein [Bacillus cereus]MCU5719417.1 hypothetical protein [Bacillus cereus]
MFNRFFDAQKHNKDFKFNNLKGLNDLGDGQSKIQIIGRLDFFTKKTLYENYDVIAKNLKVYPTIKLYPRGYELEGGFGGFYNSDTNHIDMVDHYYLVSILSHEMRHAFQFIYFPDLYFNTEYSSAREYLDCSVERDARGYSLDYCLAREYWEEAEYCKKSEEQNELVIQDKLSPSEIGLNNDYFRENPSKASIVSRNYHFDQNFIVEAVHKDQTLKVIRGDFDRKSGYIKFIVMIVLFIIIIGFIV